MAMEQNTNSSVLVKWDKVNKADGYYIYSKDLTQDENSKYKKLATVEGGDNCSYEIADLSGASVYNIKVKAYKSFLKKRVCKR
ncbi:MAG: fibronectin type III domain-containing protein [Clostridiales bacterium]|nr:fibronectin type III domain-containing protein [Clostridiales bacterium]